jgi:hypothetical protein
MGKLAPVVSETERQPTGEEMAEILERVAASARSPRGIARALADVLHVLRQCAWVEGDLWMELAADAERVSVHLFMDRGARRDRALPVVVLPISLAELEPALEREAALFAPLAMHRSSTFSTGIDH